MQSYEKTVVLASTSDRRRECLRQVPGLKVVSHPGGEEPDTPDVEDVALGKIRYVLSQIAFNFPGWLHKIEVVVSQPVHAVVAADTRTELLVGSNGASRGKPSDLSQVRRNFNTMLRADCEYRVVSGSAIQDEVGAQSNSVAVNVQLRRSRLADISRVPGFDEYLAMFEELYKSAAYQNHNLPPITPRDLSGGISLPVLLRLDAVESINQVPIRNGENEKEVQVVKDALLVVGVGFAPQVLARLHPDAIEAISRWTWLNDVAHKALRIEE